jgi:hypothetical protein
VVLTLDTSPHSRHAWVLFTPRRRLEIGRRRSAPTAQPARIDTKPPRLPSPCSRLVTPRMRIGRPPVPPLSRSSPGPRPRQGFLVFDIPNRDGKGRQIREVRARQRHPSPPATC